MKHAQSEEKHGDLAAQSAFGLYIHWPFCASKCPYCDFNSHVAETIDQERWRRAYLSDVARVAAQTGDRVLSTVFFGGGTPSLMSPDTVAVILDTVRRSWRTVNDVEVTLEANPGSVEAGRFAGYRGAGVNRLSMGVQSLRDDALLRLGRLHTSAEARRAFDIARKHFPRVSLDLIYARQDQTLADWEAELGEALAMAVDHLSLYQLTIEPSTPFAARHMRGGLRGLPDEDLAADLYERTQNRCAAAGLPSYEVSNHARPGAESRHNMIYWTGGDYAGVGPGAHGRLSMGRSRHATEALRAPQAWLAAVEAGSGMEAVTMLGARDQAREYLLMGLRPTAGLNLDRLERLWGAALSAAPISMLQEAGLVESDGAHLCTTLPGRLILNAVIRLLDEAWFNPLG